MHWPMYACPRQYVTVRYRVGLDEPARLDEELDEADPLLQRREALLLAEADARGQRVEALAAQLLLEAARAQRRRAGAQRPH